MSTRRLGWVCAVAASAEWYDFFLFATASATVLPAVFFRPLGPTGAVFASFTTFALAFVARPLGGVVFGRIGDLRGRRTALVGGTITMAAASTLIGLLPGYAVLGVVAPVLLVVLRLVQGLALGGQWAGSVLLLTERAPRGRRALYGAVAQLGSPVGGILANALFFLVAALLPAATFASLGWRAPFLLSALFVGVGLYLRLRVEDTETFRTLASRRGRSRAPVLEVLRRRPGPVLQAAGLFVAASASLYVFVTFLLTYLPRVGVAGPTALLVVTVTQAAQIPGILAGSWASDRVGRRPVHLGAAVALGVWAFPAFLLIGSGSVAGVVAALLVAHLVLGVVYGPIGALFSEMFPARVRYSGASLGYQLGTVLGGGLAPLLATALFAATGSVLAVAGYLVVVVLLTVGATLSLRETGRSDLPDDRSPSAGSAGSADADPLDARADPRAVSD